ncbi:MAG: hypothetical protein ACXACG_11650 [Candidatus Thorarchaeota archaeon]
MMISILELSVNQTIIIAISLPIVALILFVLFNRSFSNVHGSAIRRYIAFLVTPPRIDTANSSHQEENVAQRSSLLRRRIKVSLFFVYVGIALFLISFVIGEFYEVFIDILLPVTQGSTGEARIVTSVVFQSPFNAGWVGSFPWYGSLPLPSSLGTYHESWSWIFSTVAFTDNPYFFQTTFTVLLLLSFLVGLVFLAPLALKRIRHSFLSSLFFFMTGMMTFTKVAVGSLAQAWALLFGNAQIKIGLLTITGDMIPNLIQAIAFGIPIAFVMFAVFTLLGWKLWKNHYADAKSRRWFMLYISLSFWIGLALTIVLV